MTENTRNALTAINYSLRRYWQASNDAKHSISSTDSLINKALLPLVEDIAMEEAEKGENISFEKSEVCGIPYYLIEGMLFTDYKFGKEFKNKLPDVSNGKILNLVDESNNIIRMTNDLARLNTAQFQYKYYDSYNDYQNADNLFDKLSEYIGYAKSNYNDDLEKKQYIIKFEDGFIPDLFSFVRNNLQPIGISKFEIKSGNYYLNENKISSNAIMFFYGEQENSKFICDNTRLLFETTSNWFVKDYDIRFNSKTCENFDEIIGDFLDKVIEQEKYYKKINEHFAKFNKQNFERT